MNAQNPPAAERPEYDRENFELDPRCRIPDQATFAVEPALTPAQTASTVKARPSGHALGVAHLFSRHGQRFDTDREGDTP
jgi:hypothetical protein